MRVWQALRGKYQLYRTCFPYPTQRLNRIGGYQLAFLAHGRENPHSPHQADATVDIIPPAIPANSTGITCQFSRGCTHPMGCTTN